MVKGGVRLGPLFATQGESFMAPATATRSQRGEAAADLIGGATFDWDGNESGESTDYLDYLTSRPPREKLRRYAEPVFYWEVKYPGCAIHPYPQGTPIRSAESGLWRCDNDAQQEAVREHIQIMMHRNPDEFRVTDADLLELANPNSEDVRYCKTCGFTTTNQRMSILHQRETGHESSDKPRTPYGLVSVEE